LSSESEEPSINCVEEQTSEEEGMLLALPLGQAAVKVEPTASASAEGATGRQVTETATGHIIICTFCGRFSGEMLYTRI